jgi:hypothetical protein
MSGIYSMCVINPVNSIAISELYLWTVLKVPKCEIFDRSDFHDFYTIKPFWVSDFGVKILTCYFNFWGS